MIGEALTEALKSRRDALPDFASRYYELITRQVEIQATDKDEYLQCEHMPNGDLLVRIGLMEGTGGERKTPYFQRTFHPQETRAVRIYLRGGDDRAEISGTKGQIVVRIDGGGGDDTLTNLSDALKDGFYDSRGKNRFAKGKGAKIDERSYKRPPARIRRARYALDWGMQAVNSSDYQDKSGYGCIRGGDLPSAVFRLSKRPFLFATFFQASGWRKTMISRESSPLPPIPATFAN